MVLLKVLLYIFFLTLWMPIQPQTTELPSNRLQLRKNQTSCLDVNWNSSCVVPIDFCYAQMEKMTLIFTQDLFRVIINSSGDCFLDESMNNFVTRMSEYNENSPHSFPELELMCFIIKMSYIVWPKDKKIYHLRKLRKPADVQIWEADIN